ncbi:hypothetical protein ACFX1X_004395 [Malus domestica]|uniref:Transmembrane protein n=1 Tax=Malus domestica TaxID=3750 RepID=A0A498IYS7_MALDO|nr:hypothetical protein DVH24_021926 [Malus domestica]
MVHKASVVYMILIIILLLFSSEIVYANAFENPKHNDAEKMVSRSRLQKEIFRGKKVEVPIGRRSPGRAPDVPGVP